LHALQPMLGEWQGEGYVLDRESREKVTFQHSEKIYYDLDSTIIVVEGQGKSGDRIVREARAIISPADSLDQFEFYSFLASGRKGKFLLKKVDDQIDWSIHTPEGEIKYTITLKENAYHEIGRVSMNGQWYPFMEMNLRRVD